MTRRSAKLGLGILGALGAAWAAAQQAPSDRPPQLTASVEVVARSVAIDVLDAEGWPAQTVPPGSVRVFEDGVERQVLAVEPAAAAAPSGAVAAVAPAAAEPGAPVPGALPAAPPVDETRVVVALDPVTLGRGEWREATTALAAAAEALVAMGPVDVLALTGPPRQLAAGARDPAAVRAALAELAAAVKPLDAFYRGRLALLRDAQEERGAFQPATVGGRSSDPEGAALTARSIERASIANAARELAASEQRIVDEALARLGGAAAAVRRPAVLVWVAGGDLLPGEFVRQLVPESVAGADLEEIVSAGQQSAWWSALDEQWKRWAREGLRVVAWSPSRTDASDLGAADAKRPVQREGRVRLAIDPLALFESAAAATNGALVQHPGQLAEALASVRGRFVVTYQTDAAAPGWHDLRVEVAANSLTARFAPRILAPELPALPEPAPPPISLAVDLAPFRGRAPQVGRESVTLPVIVDLEPLRGLLAADAAPSFVVRIFATPPGGRPVARDVEVRLPRLPAEGSLRYETTLVVPVGTGGYAVEVREQTSGAFGAAGPVEATGAVTAAAAGGPRETDVAPGEAAPAAFSESAGITIGEARFLMPEGTAGAAADVRVLFSGAEQKLQRLAGGPGSPLELGIAIDVSESVTAERTSFLTAAANAAAKLAAVGDRVFRVDFGNAPRLVGATRGDPTALFKSAGAARPETTALFDAVRFALDRFESHSDRMALVVFTDGCETAGTTSFQEVADAGRRRAVPIFFVVADGALCTMSRTWSEPDPMVAAGVVSRGWGIGFEELKATNHSRWAASEVAKATGGRVFSLKKATAAPDAWAAIGEALGRLWVAVFEPSSPAVDPHQVEVRLGRDRVLRPSG
jgi:hypothetical protein